MGLALALQLCLPEQQTLRHGFSCIWFRRLETDQQGGEIRQGKDANSENWGQTELNPKGMGLKHMSGVFPTERGGDQSIHMPVPFSHQFSTSALQRLG